MCDQMHERTTKSAGRRALRALCAAALLVPLYGCALADSYAQSQGDPYEMPPMVGDPLLANTPPWSSTPTWGGGGGAASGPTLSVFGAPAWGPAPSISGSRLHIPPGETPAAQVSALTEQLAAAKTEAEQLTARIRGLETEVEAGNKALSRATSEVTEARAELASTRSDLEHWKREIAAMREKLDSAERDNLSTLQSTVGLLQQLIPPEEPAAENE
jgi:hypothetical protein